jgi:predicted secreted protein
MTGLARLAALLLLASVSPAMAAASAAFAAIGYSDDNRYFAFEEFSIGDEGTAPFSSVHIIDLTTGADVEGSPFWADSGEGTDSVEDVRTYAGARAYDTLTALHIGTPGSFIALIGDGMEDAGTRLRFGFPGSDGPNAVRANMALTLRTEATDIRDECSEGDYPTAANFTLSLLVDNMSQTVYPQQAKFALFCPRDFRLYGVVQPVFGSDINGLVAIVSVYSPGFEGFDRKFIAIPLRAKP